MRILVVFILLLLMGMPVMAEPIQVLGVNAERKECARFFAGDECMNCARPSYIILAIYRQ